jgi:hypothetical protein
MKELPAVGSDSVGHQFGLAPDRASATGYPDTGCGKFMLNPSDQGIDRCWSRVGSVCHGHSWFVFTQSASCVPALSDSNCSSPKNYYQISAIHR